MKRTLRQGFHRLKDSGGRGRFNDTIFILFDLAGEGLAKAKVAPLITIMNSLILQPYNASF